MSHDQLNTFLTLSNYLKCKFLFFNFEFVTQKYKNKNLMFELLTHSETLFSNFELVCFSTLCLTRSEVFYLSIQKRKYKSYTFKLITRSNILQSRVSNSKEEFL